MTKDMTEGRPLGLILLFAVPLMLGSLFQQFYNMADTIIVGRFVGVEALAAVGSVGGLSYLVLGFVNGIACGFAIPLARCFGAKDEEGMRRFTANSVWLSILFGAALTVVTVALTRPILVLTNTPADIIDLADAYIRTIFAGIPFTLLYNVTSAFMRALGDSRRPLYFLIVASAINVVLDIFFILAFDAGVFGAALATVISQAVAGVWSLAYMAKHFRVLAWSKEEGRLSPDHCAELCRMGLPMGLQCSITALGSIMLQTAVNGLGSAAVAAMTAGGKAGQILSVPLESIGTAPLAVLIVYRYSIQGLGFSGLAMFAGVFEMFARGLVGFWMVPVFGYWAGCIASPVAWFAACFFPAAGLPCGDAAAERPRARRPPAQGLTFSAAPSFALRGRGFLCPCSEGRRKRASGNIDKITKGIFVWNVRNENCKP